MQDSIVGVGAPSSEGKRFYHVSVHKLARVVDIPVVSLGE